MIESVPEFYNFAYDVVERWEQERGDALALWWAAEDAGEERKISFSQMGRSLRRAANFFARQGVRKGDKVMVILPRVPQWWVAMLGLIRLGAVPIPGTPLLTAKDIAYRLDVASVRGIVTDESGAGKVAGDFKGLRVLVGGRRDGWVDFDQDVAKESDRRNYEPTRSDEPGIIYFTSGTAGQAKMVLHTQASYGLGHLVTGKYWLDLKPEDVVWALADTGWGKTAWSSFFGPWLMGAAVFTLDMHGKFDPAVVLKTLEGYPISVFCARLRRCG